jgi:hypothetical protein
MKNGHLCVCVAVAMAVAMVGGWLWSQSRGLNFKLHVDLVMHGARHTDPMHATPSDS